VVAINALAVRVNTLTVPLAGLAEYVALMPQQSHRVPWDPHLTPQRAYAKMDIMEMA